MSRRLISQLSRLDSETLRKCAIESIGTVEVGGLYDLYTDGACSGNPGPGGWGFLIEKDGRKWGQGSGGAKSTTNNQMELQAVVSGLQAVPSSSTTHIYSDSQYVLNGLESWMENWKRNGWRTASKQPVKNLGLWKQLDELKVGREIVFHWVRGHSGHPQNEYVDRLAVEQRDLYKYM